ncbi:hypothetical protein [Pantanalinema sp. GBBB05]|uniref:hypothetical protein n=1 Tax=Pantanalinema sp. GBBB05 TaxID=2604139 RepID=UPI001D741FFE|nr:hypothetical protein [Pantanalinema sp. GBBB05]
MSSHSRIIRFPLLGWAIVLLISTTSCSLAELRKSLRSEPKATPATAALAQHLSQRGAKLYSTFWCGYCHRQQSLFADAASQLKVIECDPGGENAQPALCAQAKIMSYPTWEIDGQFYRGMRSLEELADISDYQGARNF